jgi:hypothetical protein
LPVPVGHPLDLLAQALVRVLPAARSPAVLPQSFSAIVLASSQVPVVVQVRATSHPNCRLVQAVEPTLDARDNPAAVGLETLGDRDNRAIGPAISADLAHLAIVQVTLVGRAGLAIVRVTLAVPGDPAIGQATLDAPANRAEILSRTYRAEFAIAKVGRTGARSTVTTFAIGGRTMPAISTTGSTTAGGTTMTLTGRTTRDSVTGDGRHGTG